MINSSSTHDIEMNYSWPVLSLQSKCVRSRHSSGSLPIVTPGLHLKHVPYARRTPCPLTGTYNLTDMQSSFLTSATHRSASMYPRVMGSLTAVVLHSYTQGGEVRTPCLQGGIYRHHPSPPAKQPHQLTA